MFIAVGSYLVSFWRRWSGSLCIGYSIMVIRKVIKCLNCRRGVGMERYAEFIGARELFEIMNCGLIMLWVGRIVIWGDKCENGRNVSTIAISKPICAANNALIDLSSAIKISIEDINGRNLINGEAGAIWCHIWNIVGTLNWEPMGREFCECWLA